MDLDEVLSSLSGPGLSLEGAEDRVPRKPGLYSVHGVAEAWSALGLGSPPDERPLYVGKAEDSLQGRDISTHFGNGRTGQSTVRRSMAALLRSSLGLRGVPRNPEKPGYFSNFGLSPAHDKQLTRWMRANLKLATWAPAQAVNLRSIEIQVIQAWKPPLNLTDVFTEWTDQVKAARKVMADEARAWVEDRSR